MIRERPDDASITLVTSEPGRSIARQRERATERARARMMMLRNAATKKSLHIETASDRLATRLTAHAECETHEAAMRRLRRAVVLVVSLGTLLYGGCLLKMRSHQPAKAAHLEHVAKAASMLPSLPAPPVVKVEDLPPVVMRKLTPEELSPSLIKKAEEVLWKFDSPIGSEIVIEDGGRSVIARFEQHFHEVGGPLRPWGFHKGVTLYAAE